MKYAHQSNGATAELIEKNATIAVLKFADADAPREISLSTFRRWWKPVEDEAPSEEGAPAEIDELKELDSLEDLPELPELDDAGEGAEDDEDDEDDEDAVDDEGDAPEEPAPAKPADSGKPLALSDIVKKLEDLYDILNGLYFNNALPRPVITVQSTPRAYGHCSTKKIWSSGVEGEGEAYYEINIGAEYLNRPSENTAATMCHEMIHLYCREEGIAETCQGVRYHNKLFKEEAEKRDLIVEYDRANGYTHTTPGPAFIINLGDAGFVMEIPFARHTLELKKGNKEKASRNPYHTYTCPACGQTVRTTQDLILKCGICDLPLERAQ